MGDIFHISVNGRRPEEPEEGGVCPCCPTGRLAYTKSENCSCHINPPCWACLRVVLFCDGDWHDEEAP
jgi:hypothetical protein